MSSLKLKQLAVKQVKSGNPLLIESDILNTTAIQFGNVVELLDGKTSAFLGKAILGKQNKGIGWVFTTQRTDNFDVNFVKKILIYAKNKRQSFFDNKSVEAFRLFNAESDGLGGITIDVYKESLVVSWYSQGIFMHRQMVLEAITSVMPNYFIFEKCRFEGATYETNRVSHEGAEAFVIQENAVKFNVNLNDGLMTGVFLDQRDVRDYLYRHAKEKTVLNTFSYTAAFSVAAAMGGAKETVSVDVAKRSLELSANQFATNGLALDNHRFYVMDVFEYFKYAKKKELTFDWVVLDPPSFARSKKRTFSVVKNYGELLDAAIDVTNHNGHIIVSTNASNWSRKEVLQMIEQTFKKRQQSFKIEKEFMQPDDFTVLSQLQSTQYLKVFVVKVLS